MADWYYQLMGDEYGPYSVGQIRQLAQAGDITKDSWVRKGVGSNWIIADRVVGLFGSTNGLDDAMPPPRTRDASPRTTPSPSPQTTTSKEIWKLRVGVSLLLFAAIGAILLNAIVTLEFFDELGIVLFPFSIIYILAIISLGWKVSRADPLFKALYIVACGVFLGVASLLGWKAIYEGLYRSKACGSCGRQVRFGAKPGNRCPVCGVRWKTERTFVTGKPPIAEVVYRIS